MIESAFMPAFGFSACHSVLPFCQTSQDKAVAHAAWMNRLAQQQIRPEAIAHTVDRLRCGRSPRTKLIYGLW